VYFVLVNKKSKKVKIKSYCNRVWICAYRTDQKRRRDLEVSVALPSDLFFLKDAFREQLIASVVCPSGLPLAADWELEEMYLFHVAFPCHLKSHSAMF